MLTPFHLAFNVNDLNETRAFYGDILGCSEGRSTETWVDYSFFGHQISLHLGEPFKTAATGHVGDHMVPMPHLGVVLKYDQWKDAADRLERANVDFIIKPSVRFAGEPGEQWTMFFRDPSGNPIEIKGFRNIEAVFAS
ncbi:VOC family protein [Parasulfitobacter algicola]|uniref:VOC family protein n=1 Tax=Parasulfitobacter algicola TaxID=2614809 RepID=A0ABX2ISZ9_9RHOB|nr:VOC family protein [Sulfitobacter algicola]NSX56039.1 VOC family protein [Sulfitobacter algicola]